MADLPLEHVHVPPAAADPPEPAPAALVLHGRGADEEDLLPVARRLPDSHHVLSLRAPDRLGPGYTWYDLDLSGGGLDESQPDAEGFRRSLDLIGAAADAAPDAYGVDPDRIGLVGFSQGAVSALALVVEAPARWAWTAALHGYLAGAHADRATGLDGAPVLVTAGLADEVIPAARAATAAERLRAAGAAVDHREYETGHGIGPAEAGDVVAFVRDHCPAG